MKDPKSAQVQEIASFESALKQLELIVQKMEEEDLSIEEALGHFETGIKLSAHCQQVLKAAEQKIEVVQNSISNFGPGGGNS